MAALTDFRTRLFSVAVRLSVVALRRPWADREPTLFGRHFPVSRSLCYSVLLRFGFRVYEPKIFLLPERCLHRELLLFYFPKKKSRQAFCFAVQLCRTR